MADPFILELISGSPLYPVSTPAPGPFRLEVLGPGGVAAEVTIGAPWILELLPPADLIPSVPGPSVTWTLELGADAVLSPIPLAVPFILQAGTPGPKGDPGAAGTPEIVSLGFAFGDAPSAVYVMPGAGRIVEAELSFRTAFNGSGATVKVGTAFGDGSIIGPADNDPAVAGSYGVPLDLSLAGSSPVWITIDPAGSTSGGGFLTLYLSFA